MADPTLALFYEFARNKSLVASQGLGPTLDIVRTTEKRVFGSTGLLETVAAGAAGFDHDPVTGASLGLLVEEARTNLCLQSERPTLAPWTTLISPVINETSAISPDGTLNAISINDNNGAGFEAIVQQISIPNDSATYTFSMYIKKTAAGTAPTMGVNIVLIGGTNPGDLPIPRIFTDTGFVQDLQAGANSRIIDAGDYWRLVTTVGNNSTGNTIYEIQIFPATAANGFLPNISQAVGINTVWGMQMEVGAFPTSYIPTTTATVTRNADVVNTTDMSWFNPNVGTIFATIRQVSAVNQDESIIDIGDGSNNNRFLLKRRQVSELRFTSRAGGVSSTTLNQGSVFVLDTPISVAMSYAVDDFELFVAGTRTGTGDQLGALPTGINALGIGSRAGTSSEIFNGHIAELRYYNIRKPNQFHQDHSGGLISEDNDLTFARHVARPLARNLKRTF